MDEQKYTREKKNGSLTNDECQILELSRTPLTLDSRQTFLDKVLRGLVRLLIDDDQIHGLGDETRGHSDVDSSLLSVASEDPDLHISPSASPQNFSRQNGYTP